MSAAPIIICPYLHAEDAEKVRRAFGLEEPRGRKLEFFLWQDRDRIGPERAFQHCWSQFPERDVIIIHPDMAPLPEDIHNSWYERLLEYAQQLPEAGALACDLLFPPDAKNGVLCVQSGGGLFVDGQIQHVFSSEVGYDEGFRWPRLVPWATFGGIFLRRAAIDACGGFDERYSWAYVMDVDYSLEMRKRGFAIYQVPVNLIHEESGTTKVFLQDESYRLRRDRNQRLFHEKWKDSPLLQMESEFIATELLFKSLQYHSRLESIKTSWSWRITAPLRSLSDRFLSLIGRLKGSWARS